MKRVVPSFFSCLKKARSGLTAFFLLISLVTSVQGQVLIDTIIIAGNKVTREGIIRRECILKEGKWYAEESLATLVRKSKENLMNTSLFNFVQVTTDLTGNEENKLTVNINVVERWYIWPVPILKISDRNFNVWWKTRDLSRISYGLYIDWNNLSGRADKLRSTIQLGYDEEINFDYSIPYLNEKKTFGAGISFQYRQNHEVAVGTIDNKNIFYKREDTRVVKSFNFSARATVKHGYYNTHEFNLGYSQYHFNDSLVMLYPWYSSGTNKDQFLSIYYKFKSDHRDYHAYPLEGYYFDLEMNKYGLGLVSGSGPNFFTIGSAFRKYWQFYDFLYYAFGLNGRFSDNRFQPYYLVRGIGYGRDAIRGYELYVIDAGNYAIFKTNLKFKLFSKSDARIPFIKSDRFGRLFYGFYLNFFLDMGYADKSFYYGENGSLHNELLAGYGAGLDFTTYYDMVIRFEYSYNRRGEAGFFIHFMASI